MSARETPKPLEEGVDYYVEAGRWVFTAHFHRTRGYCCKSGCRHCPYGFRKGGAELRPDDPDGRSPYPGDGRPAREPGSEPRSGGGH